MVTDREDRMVQRGHYYTIVDEVDSILIDEARTPLIISGAVQESRSGTSSSLASPALPARRHYEVDEKKRTIAITEEGVRRSTDPRRREPLRPREHRPGPPPAELRSRRRSSTRRTSSTSSSSGEVLIVDEFTGRILPGRRYSEGLHQAIEAKENVRSRRRTRPSPRSHCRTTSACTRSWRA